VLGKGVVAFGYRLTWVQADFTWCLIYRRVLGYILGCGF